MPLPRPTRGWAASSSKTVQPPLVPLPKAQVDDLVITSTLPPPVPRAPMPPLVPAVPPLLAIPQICHHPCDCSGLGNSSLNPFHHLLCVRTQVQGNPQPQGAISRRTRLLTTTGPPVVKTNQHLCLAPLDALPLGVDNVRGQPHDLAFFRFVVRIFLAMGGRVGYATPGSDSSITINSTTYDVPHPLR